PALEWSSDLAPSGRGDPLSKRGRERWLIWLGGAVLALCAGLAVGALFYQLHNSTTPLALRYGDLVQTLRVSGRGAGVSFRDVKVGHGDIRGEIVATDRVSTAGDERTHTLTVPFRTSRIGFERDQDIYALLRDSAGAGYQGPEDDAAMRTIG